MPTIDGDLRLVLPLRSDAEGNVLVWGYHTPISTETFRANCRVLGATAISLFEPGLNNAAAMLVSLRLASAFLRDEGRSQALKRGDVDNNGNPKDDAVRAFLDEIQRLTIAVVPSEGGWEGVPLAIAAQRGKIDEGDLDDAEGALIFFTCVWHTLPREWRRAAALNVLSRMKASTTSLPLLDWIASLPTSMPGGSTAGAAA